MPRMWEWLQILFQGWFDALLYVKYSTIFTINDNGDVKIVFNKLRIVF